MATKTLVGTPDASERIRRARLAWIAETMRDVFVALPDRVRRMSSCPPCTVKVYDTESGRRCSAACQTLY